MNLIISGVFSPIKSDQEEKAKLIFDREFKKAGVKYNINLSHKFAQLGLLERESATVLNTSLLEMADRHINSFYRALHKLQLSHAAIFLTQNDGTLITAEQAKIFPVLTFSSGATNSLRGASKLVSL